MRTFVVAFWLVLICFDLFFVFLFLWVKWNNMEIVLLCTLVDLMSILVSGCCWGFFYFGSILCVRGLKHVVLCSVRPLFVLVFV